MATVAETAALRAAFRQEVAVWHKLDHPNVTKVKFDYLLLCFSVEFDYLLLRFSNCFPISSQNQYVATKIPSKLSTIKFNYPCRIYHLFLFRSPLCTVFFFSNFKLLVFKLLLNVFLSVSWRFNGNFKS